MRADAPWMYLLCVHMHQGEVIVCLSKCECLKLHVFLGIWPWSKQKLAGRVTLCRCCWELKCLKSSRCHFTYVDICSKFAVTAPRMKYLNLTLVRCFSEGTHKCLDKQTGCYCRLKMLQGVVGSRPDKSRQPVMQTCISSKLVSRGRAPVENNQCTYKC